jgi:hypothetical protein
MARIFNKEFLANIVPVETEAIGSNEVSEISAEPKTTLREAYNKLSMSDVMAQSLGQQAKDEQAKKQIDNSETLNSIILFMKGLRGIMQLLSGMNEQQR